VLKHHASLTPNIVSVKEVEVEKVELRPNLAVMSVY